MMNDLATVKVAVRIRPLVQQELERGCREVVEALPEYSQIVIKSNDRTFTFNHVYGVDSHQQDLYQTGVQPLLKNVFEGMNLTIFAYGQTGSGKTYSMGTTYTGENCDYMGVIPRIVNEIFEETRNCFCIDFVISVSFLELYREALYDLLGQKPKDQCNLEIREDPSKGILIPNLTEITVESAKEVLDLLAKGSSSRATGLTHMNAQSSRSHSIFTINIAMQHKTDKSKNKVAKLHLVDLAGSERSKKTGAQGTTFKEGIDINKGLLALGKVISALGDEKQQHNFIPYRDSNLTRLLKDSLGGNSVTLMIACVSPADYNLEETLSTLRYADGAKKIKNKPIVNQDPKTSEINNLKKQIKQLKLEIIGQGGSTLSTEEIDKLQSEIRELHVKVKTLHSQLSATLMQKTAICEQNILLQKSNESLTCKLNQLKQKYNGTFENLNNAIKNNDLNGIKDNLQLFSEIQESLETIQDEHSKAETEIRKYEESVTNLLSSESSSVENEKCGHKEESHNMKQIELNSELQEITKRLFLKEELARKLTTNVKFMVNEQAMTEIKNKIETLENEKQDLLQQLTNVKVQEMNGKVATQRRKRIQELEEELKDLKKKINEQSRLIKLRDKDQQKIQQLNNEIVGMKSTKVKLIKQMREEFDRFRAFKLENEKQLTKVKNQERKKESEIAKLKINYEKQKIVLKRKFEEAAALNKRLQNTLMKKVSVQQAKFGGKMDKVSNWIKEDLDVYVDFIEAESTLAELLEDRAVLQQQLDQLKCHPNKENNEEIANIEHDIELRSIQIQDLQQKLIDSKDDDKLETRFECLQTMSNAKFAMKAIYLHAATYCKDRISNKRAITELQETNNALQKQNEHMTQTINQLNEKHNEQLSDLQQIYEEKVSILLRQLRGIKTEENTKDKELQDRCAIQLERLEQQDFKIEQQQQIIKELEQKLTQKTKEVIANGITTPDSKSLKTTEENILNTTFINSTFTIPGDKINQTRTIDQKQDNMPLTSAMKQISHNIADTPAQLDQSFIDDKEKDPDWCKTPLGKRIVTEKKGFLNRVGLKRTSEGGCTCSSILCCNTKRCGCKKSGNLCNMLCKCKKENCSNQDSENKENGNRDINTADNTSDSASTSSGAFTEDTYAFKKPK